MKLKQYSIIVAVLFFGVGLYVAQKTSQPFQAHLSGDWYPHDRDELLRVLDQAERKSDERCGKIAATTPNIKAIIVPHAGYQYAADIAVSAYRHLDSQHISRIIILAPSHAQAFKGVALPFFTQYQTPLGILNIDTGAVATLQKHALFNMVTDVWAHEHAVEVQLPYIQKYMGDHSAIVPLIVADATSDELKDIAQKLLEIIDDRTLVVISSDLIHYGTRFGYTPFDRVVDTQAAIKKLDMIIMDAIMQQNASTFEFIIQETGATVCGRMPIQLFKILEQLLPYALSSQLLCYKTSYDVDHTDPKSSVSYATIIFDQQAELSFSAADKKRILDEVRAIIAASCADHRQKKDAASLHDIRSLQEWRGLFVTLRTKNGDLRGCMGHVIPDRSLIKLLPNIARLTAFGDPRFAPVTCDELHELNIEVSILSMPRSIDNYQGIILGKHGIILSAQDKGALFLPKVALEQGWDLPTTLSELARKAELPSDIWKSAQAHWQVFESLDFGDN